MRVLLSLESTMCRFPGDHEPTLALYSLIGSLRALGHREFLFFYNQFTSVQESSKALLTACHTFGPDIVLTTPVLALEKNNIPPECYQVIRDRMGIPVVSLWLESAPNVVTWADMYAAGTTANVFFDTYEHWKKFTKHPDKTYWLPEPRDPTLFNCDEKIERDLPLTFVGSVLGRIDRALNLAWVTGSGIEVKVLGGAHPSSRGSIYDYVGWLRRSKITLNFTSACTFEHLTGRTAEATMCGAMLLESESIETSRLFSTMAEYVPFTEPFHYNNGQLEFQDTNLIERLRYYMGVGAKEAEDIARAGHRKAVETFDGRVFWDGIAKIVGVSR